MAHDSLMRLYAVVRRCSGEWWPAGVLRQASLGSAWKVTLADKRSPSEGRGSLRPGGSVNLGLSAVQ